MLEDQSVLRVPPSTPPLKRDAAAGWADGALYTIQPSRWVSSFTETERRERRVKEGEREERRRRWKSSKRERERCGGDDRGEGSMEVKAQEWRAVRWKKAGREKMTSWRVISADVELSASFMDSWAHVQGGRCRNMTAIKHPNEIWGKRISLSVGPTHCSQYALGWWHAHFYKCKDQSPVLFAPSFRDVFSTFHHRNDLIADFPSCLDPIWNQPPHVLLTAERLHLCLIFNKTVSWLNVSALQTLLFIWAAPVESADFWLRSEHASKISWFLNGVWCKVLQLLHQWLVSGEVPAPHLTLHLRIYYFKEVSVLRTLVTKFKSSWSEIIKKRIF